MIGAIGVQCPFSIIVKTVRNGRHIHYPVTIMAEVTVLDAGVIVKLDAGTARQLAEGILERLKEQST